MSIIHDKSMNKLSAKLQRYLAPRLPFSLPKFFQAGRKNHFEGRIFKT